MDPAQNPSNKPTCGICTFRLELICDRRARWFRAFRAVLRGGIRVFALVYGIGSEAPLPRAPMCHRCLRFRKNALKRKSRLFDRLDGFLNPIFNRARDKLLTEAELAEARTLARLAEDRGFRPEAFVSALVLGGGSRGTKRSR